MTADTTPLPVVFTIGHSTRTIDGFLELLNAHGVQHVVDVRSIPQSRHNPQFARHQLRRFLAQSQLYYTHMPGLGGRRRARADSKNMGWRNASFRGYADYMETQAFKNALDECVALARKDRIVLMCAEAVPWRCHRSLIADALIARGLDVRDIVGATQATRHALTPWARVNGTEVTYPAAGDADSPQ